MGVTINQSIKPHPREQISLVMNARRVFVYLRVLFHLVSATLFGGFCYCKAGGRHQLVLGRSIHPTLHDGRCVLCVLPDILGRTAEQEIFDQNL